MNAPLVLLDSASLWFRSFHALPESLTAPDGTPVNAVRGFVDTVSRIVSDRRPGRLVCCLDADWRPEFRVRALPSYKAHRVAEEAPHEGTEPGAAESVPDTLTPQVPIILDVLAAAGLATAEAAGFEADDVIGTLAAREDRDPVEIVTGDRDLFQTVRTEPTSVVVLYVGRGWLKRDRIGPAELAAKYGIPEEGAGSAYAEMAMLRGDPSDGLPGVPGIGEKTAARLITGFGSLAALRKAAEEGSAGIPARARAALLGSADYLDVAPTVVRVALDAPISGSDSDLVPTRPADPARLAELGERWGLGGSLGRLTHALGAADR
ncbi:MULTISPECIES: 5'-3' exonuclease [Actinoalloteichus]|uniref:5'-3' exonuclease n=1 Tax=Actinoalloteichus fjordicus TaxID=1612552 RepID=A0AAC9LD30_9PSEU|nr:MULTISPECIES: 5'-3' exonuclease [Actinoalloteichus]APU14649.1 5'-3' exonuclease (including N-terminal domain of PolI) [Actinoalloteichus fjordicus]APU20617.1 5'-3' exonuclease (including N-terminal domain of PolI) [Actinoalloteichus sp. GBA129-24]